jgi:hypothetical protein
LYPGPVQNSPSLLSQNPLALAGVVSNIQANQRANALFNAQRAVGGAFQSALNPDGSIDQTKLASGLTNPDAALAAPEAMTTMLGQRGQMISNATNQFNLGAGQNDYVVRTLGPLVNNPNVNKDDVAQVIPNLVRAGVPPAMVYGWYAGLPSGGSGLRRALGNINSVAMGAGAATSRVQGPPSAGGASTTTSLGSTAYGAGATPTELTPQAKADIDEYTGDQTKAATTLANVRPLQQALPLIQQLGNTEFGPPSPGFTKLKATLAGLGVIDPNTSDGSVRQEVGKYLLRYASGAQAAGRSDQALSAAMGSNPNPDTMMKPAVLGVLKNQIGLDRMDAALPLAAGGAPGYKPFKSTYYQNMDPRAFQFDLMSPQERAALQTSLGPKGSPAYQKFINSYKIAKQTGMIAPSQPPGQ